MTLQIIGKISMQDAECEKCRERISIWVCSDKIRCGNCGAIYNVLSSNLEDQYVEYEFEFDKFQCMHNPFSDGCDNACPAPNMYCKEHSTDACIESAESSLAYCQAKLIESENRLDAIKESKRIWLIEEVSGINEDDSV